MKLMLLVAGILMALGIAVLIHVPAHAEQTPGVKIVLVQATGSDAKFERIDILNTGTEAADLSGWKLLYRTATGSTASMPPITITAPVNWHVLLAPSARESFVSKELASVAPLNPTLAAAEQFTSGMSHTGGGLQLIDAANVVVDRVGWGSASPEYWGQQPAPAMTATTWLVRSGFAGANSDFTSETQDVAKRPFAIGFLQEVADLCVNIPGLQQVLPDGFDMKDGVCAPLDVCSNVDGVQEVLPAGMEMAGDGMCQVIDVCQNLPEIQATVPVDYELTGSRYCEPAIVIRKLLITEVLPNPSGSDDGSEFVELYNADTEPIPLKDYMLMIGDTPAVLPADRVLAPGEFLILSDTDLGKHLPNTTGVPLYLMTVRKVEVMSVPAYMNAKDDASWALFDDGWRYTVAPTPGGANVSLVGVPCEVGFGRDEATGRCRKLASTTIGAPVPCRDGQYRSEETGRCRTIAAPTALTPCKDGQYRSEETNRCRSFATLAVSSLKPCADDQFRNPLTNRCKSIASSDEVGVLADCGEGRERNPATNRCRNIATAAAPLAAFKAEPVKDTAEAFAGWWALGGVGLLAAGYAGWEWRREVADLVRRASAVIARR